MVDSWIIPDIRLRKCGNEWRYCNGVCSICPLTNKYYSTSATPKGKDINVPTK